MTEKEFSKLRRQDLLQLLLAQGREAKQADEQIAALQQQCQELEGTCNRLKEKLDDKDRQLDRLKGRLNQKDASIRDLRETLEGERASRTIQLREDGNIAQAALRLNGVFEAAQNAADQYLENIQHKHAKLDMVLQQREADCAAQCDKLRQETVAQCEALRAETRAACERLTVRTAVKCARMRHEGKS
jgi:chromosome segregation ATPase